MWRGRGKKQATEVWTQGLSGDIVQHMESKGEVTLPPKRPRSQ